MISVNCYISGFPGKNVESTSTCDTRQPARGLISLSHNLALQLRPPLPVTVLVGPVFVPEPIYKLQLLIPA